MTEEKHNKLLFDFEALFEPDDYLYEEFDRVILLFTSFGIFDDEEDFKVLENVARSLKTASSTVLSAGRSLG
ncbi:MAG: hypothetical protein ACE5K4_12625 [Candidatus Hydrothermarchaeota archaeon]